MKKYLLPPLLIALVFTACENSSNTKGSLNKDSIAVPLKQEEIVQDHHNTKNSIDWAGTYEGTLPCADCPGIHVVLTLKTDDTFEKVEHYLEKSDPIKETGTFSWTPDGGAITLKEKDGESKYKIGEGIMKKLDLEGKEITGDFAELYHLKKID